MIARTISCLPLGFDGSLVEIEGDKKQGLPAFNIVGMAGKTVSEARERVKSALSTSGFSFPDQRLTLNLAPADLEKDGTYLDLPIAINILILSGQLRQTDVNDAAFTGELSLDGGLRPVRGIINIAETAKKAGIPTLFLPCQNLAQASLVSGINLIGVDNLFELFLHLKGQKLIEPPQNVVKNTKTEEDTPDFISVKGQSLAKRALTIAIAGRHNILLSGPPGTGKTMLARAALDLLPKPTQAEQISITKLHSLAGLADNVIESRPFRTPHHTSSLASLIGGGAKASPGEISLAHLGVLFLDELPEYPRSLLEALRQPLEDRKISISRVNNKFTYPADFMLIATMNPCPCGYLGDPVHPCTCTANQIAQYQKKLSGPLLDRIDLFVDVDRIKPSELLEKHPPKTTKNVVKNTITEAIKAQHARYDTDTTFNANLSSAEVAQKISLKPDVKSLLNSAAEKLNLSARGYFKVIKVARTIADLENSPDITTGHITEALSFRRKESASAF